MDMIKLLKKNWLVVLLVAGVLLFLVYGRADEHAGSLIELKCFDAQKQPMKCPGGVVGFTASTIDDLPNQPSFIALVINVDNLGGSVLNNVRVNTGRTSPAMFVSALGSASNIPSIPIGSNGGWTSDLIDFTQFEGSNPTFCVGVDANFYESESNPNALIQRDGCVTYLVENACADGLTTAPETDVDCGGGVCPACAGGDSCVVNADCQSNVCIGGICVNPDAKVILRTSGSVEADYGLVGTKVCADHDGDGDLDCFERTENTIGGCANTPFTTTPSNQDVFFYNALINVLTPTNCYVYKGWLPDDTSGLTKSLKPEAGFEGKERYCQSGCSACGNTVCEDSYGDGETFRNCPLDCGAPSNPVTFRTNYFPAGANYNGAWGAAQNNWIAFDVDGDGDLEVYARSSLMSTTCFGTDDIVLNDAPGIGTVIRIDSSDTGNSYIKLCPTSTGGGYKFNALGNTAECGPATQCASLISQGVVALTAKEPYATNVAECYQGIPCA